MITKEEWNTYQRVNRKLRYEMVNPNHDERCRTLGTTEEMVGDWDDWYDLPPNMRPIHSETRK